MSRMTNSHLSRQRRQRRIRAKISGTADRPRLAVYRSLQHISAQLIDDKNGKTLMAATDKELPKGAGNKTARAQAVGKLLATKAKTVKITTVVFDRGGFQFHGRVKALADGAREGGLKF